MKKKLTIPEPIQIESISFPKTKLSEIIEFYEYLVCQALAQVNRGILSDALKVISEAAKIAYLINWRYHDERLEVALENISSSLLPKTKKNSKTTDIKIIFFDSWGLDSRGLSLQYIRALNTISLSILFICENRNEAASIGIREELSRNLNNKIIYLNLIHEEGAKAKKIKTIISDFGPSHIFMHMTPWATGAIAAFHSFPDIPRYQINLTDHAYWLGTGCSDYCLEFRRYGLTVSQEKRGIAPDRTILNPFYPIVEDKHSNSLPPRTKGEVVILTGGAYYKMYGRQGFFFDLIAEILDRHPDVIFWIAGNGRRSLLEKRMYKYLKSGRVKLIGDRNDINSVFKVSDIYLSTYPFSGGLMAQLATANGVPTLSFTSSDLVNNQLDDILCDENAQSITFTDVEAFLLHASTLIDHIDARLATASLAKDTMYLRSKFELRTSEIINKPDSFSFITPQKISIDYKVFTSMYLEIENYFQDSLARRLLRNTTFKTAFNFPLLTAKSIMHIVFFIFIKYKSKLFG